MRGSKYYISNFLLIALLPRVAYPFPQSARFAMSIQSAPASPDPGGEAWAGNFPVVARKIQRWLDDLSTPDLVFHSSAAAVDGVHSSRTSDDFLRKRLEYEFSLLEGAAGAVKLYADAPSLVLVRDLIERLSWGKGVFQARLFRLNAVIAFGAGRSQQAQRWRSRSLALIPSDLPVLSKEFNGNLNNRGPTFERWWSSRNRPLPCRVSLEVLPAEARRWWNGFPNNDPEVSLPLGNHELRLSHLGYVPILRTVSCHRVSRSTLRFSLTPEEKTGLTNTAEQRGVGSPGLENATTGGTALWVEPRAGRVRLFLHTPGIAFDEVVTSRPIRLTDLLDNAGGKILADPDAMLRLVEGHRVASVSADASASGIRQAAMSTSELVQKSYWYEDWRVWTVVGALAVGITVGALAQSGVTVGTNQASAVPTRSSQ